MPWPDFVSTAFSLLLHDVQVKSQGARHCGKYSAAVFIAAMLSSGPRPRMVSSSVSRVPAHWKKLNLPRLGGSCRQAAGASSWAGPHVETAMTVKPVSRQFCFSYVPIPPNVLI